MTSLSAFFGPNAGYVLDLYDRYRLDPSCVDEATKEFLDQLDLSVSPNSTSSQSLSTTSRSSLSSFPTHCNLPSQMVDCVQVGKVVGATRYARYIRQRGHLAARLDPLGSQPPGDSRLDKATHGLTDADLEALPACVVRGLCNRGAKNFGEAARQLLSVYSGTVGYEVEHIPTSAERDWLRESIETERYFKTITDDDRLALLQRLTEVECFERFLHQTFSGQKRFSIEGVDILAPILDEIIHLAAARGARQVVIGMAHRGRLNVLAHVLGKPYEKILAEFLAAHAHPDPISGSDIHSGWAGDVKYHQGARTSLIEEGYREMPITLAPNPSHLEFINPVIEGRARAAQERRDVPGRPLQDKQASQAILVHGDAAFPGQGVVAETLNLSRLNGYNVGGTIHIITNNQIGFTTRPKDSRSTLYASDLAKGFEIPIVHVNADDPEACLAVTRLACAYREKFQKDFLIDVVGYRRWGHNEGDEPGYTQPELYAKIDAHLTVRALWANALENRDLISKDFANESVVAVMKTLEAAKEKAVKLAALADDTPTERFGSVAELTVPVAEEKLKSLNNALLTFPEDFTLNSKLVRVFEKRRNGFEAPGGIDWAHAESLALASILSDGVPIRLTGQDSQRGTFSQRHATMHDPYTGGVYTPLEHLPGVNTSFAIYNSPLSEISTVGFEYGYCSHASGALVLWEAQFGDFSNCAQVIIDQFIIAGAAKWNHAPSLVMLLPHGYEGQGPEHSSARIERYLQLAANGNIRILNCTTAAQYYHALRRQSAALSLAPAPLIIFTPKSLLRHSKAASSLSDLTRGRFRPIIADPVSVENDEQVTRLVLCSGKIWVDMATSPAYPVARNIATARIEELYPFPSMQLSKLLSRYPNLRQVVWLQEEPANQGAWSFMHPRLLEAIAPNIDLRYIGRAESASPAEGSLSRHKAQQERIIEEALSDIPEIKVKRSAVTHVI